MRKTNIRSLDIYKVLSDNNYLLTKVGCGVTAVALTLTLAIGGLRKPKEMKDSISIEYTVQTHDTLFEIANKLGVSVDSIIKDNNIEDPDFIRIGQKLIINNVNELGTANIEMYTVKSGDTLTSIANQFGVTIDSIIKYNNIENPDFIEVGQEIIVDKNEQENEESKEEIKNEEDKYENDSNFSLLGQDINLPEGLSRGIDLSAWNSVNWDELEKSYRNNEFSYVILRMAETLNGFDLDRTFEKNLSECNKRGIPYGVYVFSRGSNEQEIQTETSLINKYINENLNRNKIVNGEELDLSFNLSLPFYMDCFEQDASKQFNLYANENYDYCKQLIDLWCSTMENEGYFTGVYCGGSFYKAMGQERLKDYSLWIAHYGNKVIYDEVQKIGLNGCVTFDGIVKNQQITEAGKLNGIDGYVDVNVCEDELIDIVQSFYESKNNQNGLIRRLANN